MVNRILNEGRTHVNGTDLLALLADVARDANYPVVAGKEAEGFLEWQRGRA